ncbi:glycosyltransferase [Endozoicomonas sp.]|nr:glycosyltransferase [Endozoicomonas sp.]
MIFSNKSDVTLVITCCGRIDLLKQTLDSFFQFNTYPIKKVIITEDSGNEAAYSVIPDEKKEFFTIIVNKKNIGQIKSIDKAYAMVDTDYIFHCEEDWHFYRKKFIEDSKAILEADSHVYQVRLRSFYHDIAKEYPFHSLGKEIKASNVIAYQLLSSKEKWQGFSFNPGLRRLSDYLEINNGYSSFLEKEKQAINVESALSKHMKNLGRYVAILENDATAHIGYEQHIASRKEKKKKFKKNTCILALAFSLFILGWLAAKL